MQIPINSINHPHATRAHIPTNEEAGWEQSAIDAAGAKLKAEFPLNPVTHRGKDPELYWLNKYGNDDREERLKIDIRSLYRHEHISPELLMKHLYSIKENPAAEQQLSLMELFGNAIQMDELEKVGSYYTHSDKWENRLIQGDSLLVMTSLLEREGMAGKVQTIYMDPPYGINYSKNWQIHLNDRGKGSDNDDGLSGEPEMIKAFRDTWELGIHSYLSYLRDRLLIAKELLTDSGSCFMQISDENVHLVRNVMDEVFGSENFVSQIFFQKTGGFNPKFLSNVGDHLLWYGKNKSHLKYNSLFELEHEPPINDPNYVWLAFPNGEMRKMTVAERRKEVPLPKDARIFRHGPLQSDGSSNSPQDFEFEGVIYKPTSKNHWKVTVKGLENLKQKGELIKSGNSIAWKLFWDYYPASKLKNVWLDTQSGGFSDSGWYVVQTTNKVIERCLLMTTDPGDLVLDPTCGSGTTAFVAEQWGRRWITTDTSRIALNIAKTRLMTATFPFYKLRSEEDIRQGFEYKKVPHITLKSLANDEPAEEETLYDQPLEDKKKLRVAGPFTVETLQNFEVTPPEALDESRPDEGEVAEAFEARVFEHLKSAGVMNGNKQERAVFRRVERLSDPYLHAEGYYTDGDGKERKAYLYIGPKFGTVSRLAVNEAIKACRMAGDADWLLILGFAFESDISGGRLGGFEVTKTRIHDDLMQDGLIKKAKGAASFVTIGEPDIALNRDGDNCTVEIRGLDIYDPISDQVRARSVADIAYWMVDDDYDGSNFIVRQVFFCGGDKDEFNKWKKGLTDMTKPGSTRAKAEKTLKIELDDDAWDRLYGFTSHPIEAKPGRKVAVRVISQFGEESMKVLSV